VTNAHSIARPSERMSTISASSSPRRTRLQPLDRTVKSNIPYASALSASSYWIVLPVKACGMRPSAAAPGAMSVATTAAVSDRRCGTSADTSSDHAARAPACPAGRCNHCEATT
jgi:hypothetical protein